MTIGRYELNNFFLEEERNESNETRLRFKELNLISKKINSNKKERLKIFIFVCSISKKS